jgi:hypothetical protein
VSITPYAITASGHWSGAVASGRGNRHAQTSAVTTVGAPQDITAQEIRIEAFYPVDPATDRHHWS